MNNNKTFFILSSLGGTLVNNVGTIYTNVNLKNLLGHIYDKYTAFNLKLESYRTSNLSGSTTIGSSFLHMSGFHWINGYDTISPLYSTSRVIESLQTPFDTDPDFFIGINFLSNANCISFYRPSSFIIPEIILFYTNADGTFFTTMPDIASVSFCFSITGIDAYKILNPTKGLVYRMYNAESAYLVLDSNNAVSIDPFDSTQFKKRIFVFKNVNWRTIIGAEMYDKYNKFSLITVRTHSESLQQILPTGSTGATMYLSGSNLNFERTSILPGMPITTNSTSVNNAVIRHHQYPVFIGHMTITGLSRRIFTQTHIENVFIKPSNPIGDIVVNVSVNAELNIHTSTAGTNPFPVFILGFNIVPVIEN